MDVVKTDTGHLLTKFHDSQINSGCAAARRSCWNLEGFHEAFGVKSEAVSRLDMMEDDVGLLHTNFQLVISTFTRSREV